MASIFGRQETQLGGVFNCDDAVLSFDKGVTGVLVQGAQFTYAQNVTRLYEIGDSGNKPKVYYVGGRTQGQGGISRVVGPNATIKQLYSVYGNVCNACSNTMVLNMTKSNCGSGGSCSGGSGQVKYTLKYVVLTQVGVSVQAQDMIINEQSQVMFSGCDVD